MKIANFLFKYRSYTPIPLALYILINSNFQIQNLIIGLTLIFIGELLRIWAVSYAGGITRTTKVGAPSLCTTGPYSYTRNPLYIGNMIIYTGVVYVAGSYNILSMLIITWTFFIIQYYLIIKLEQNRLIEIFGKEYKAYMDNVPILFPRLSPWINKDKYVPMKLLNTIKTEKRTLQNIILLIIIIYFKNQFI
ncbi:MAG: isoprenylcysteine carboxylmethyltransferase family protein [Candidatus Neomarinimicrobiota bacterium]|jgi:protein-S-isoprenylcysteine O-methyltransferase Ste14|nr:protein-S-isoprenylcysteine methyltransferase [Candidatus Neomarinimicrobiota bacterium]MEC7936028.1 isoprenylcysteine carboxylmethyltransferase family protein [Candidatus Neomarinimicrobiota bacterium]MEC9027110.1 isoprenylcysteine carboxylmethyltransferase family protein [Candidatus Neomarinimicrobiota bacterium]MED5256174.1 isoprenylcysteine carboxylmethyltransferase family protein [Candidatus Neomarinimicrobiota bacterium]MED5266646.1 isoprenylcysteine carboxylmethyltransferase family pr|tara:strand:- start:4661 stop:5236 length:576 start_codon:yes stop_codon:yes gene_type:complete